MSENNANKAKGRDVAVVIPNWNGDDYISKCLKSLEKQSIKCEIIVVDNGSIDKSVEIIKKSHPRVTLLEFPNNAGFAGGVNRGISYAIEKNYKYVGLFNNDAVADHKWLQRLIEVLDSDKSVGIATGKLMISDKKHLDSTGECYTIWGMPFPRGRNQLDKGQYSKKEPVFGASGGASLYRIDMLKEIGLFDEDFFAYYEDVDISFRAQNADYKVVYTPEAVAYHAVGGTSKKLGDFSRYHSLKNFILLYFRNMPLSLLFKYLPLFGLQYSRLFIGAVANGKPHIFVKSTVSAIKLSRQTLKIRKHNKKLRKISAKDIDKLLVKSRPPKIPTIG